MHAHCALWTEPIDMLAYRQRVKCVYKWFENVCVHMDFDLCEFYASESSPFNFHETDSCLFVRSFQMRNRMMRKIDDQVMKNKNSIKKKIHRIENQNVLFHFVLLTDKTDGTLNDNFRVDFFGFHRCLSFEIDQPSR